VNKSQLLEGSYFIIGRRFGIGAVAGVLAALASIYLGIHMELNGHRSRLDMLERATATAPADHDALVRVLVIQERMAEQLKRIEGYLMEGRERSGVR